MLVCNLLKAWNDFFVCECLIFICNSWVCYRVRVTRRIEFTYASASIGVFFFYHMRVRVIQRVKCRLHGCKYGWPLSIEYVLVAILCVKQ